MIVKAWKVPQNGESWISWEGELIIENCSFAIAGIGLLEFEIVEAHGSCMTVTGRPVDRDKGIPAEERQTWRVELQPGNYENAELEWAERVNRAGMQVQTAKSGV